jgi:hypothetical protein
MWINTDNGVTAATTIGWGWQCHMVGRVIGMHSPIGPSRVFNLPADSQVYPTRRVQAIARTRHAP